MSVSDKLIQLMPEPNQDGMILPTVFDSLLIVAGLIAGYFLPLLIAAIGAYRISKEVEDRLRLRPSFARPRKDMGAPSGAPMRYLRESNGAFLFPKDQMRGETT